MFKKVRIRKQESQWLHAVIEHVDCRFQWSQAYPSDSNHRNSGERSPILFDNVVNYIVVNNSALVKVFGIIRFTLDFQGRQTSFETRSMCCTRPP